MSGEIIIDGKRKRSWPKEVKRRIVEESYAPGVSVCEVARRYDLEPSQLFHWRKRFRDDAETTSCRGSGGAAEFFPIELAAPVSAENGRSAADNEDQASVLRGVEIAFPNGRRLIVAAGLDRRFLEDLIGAVSSA